MKLARLVNPKVALVALGGYAAICSMVYFRQRTILYRPAKPNRETPPATVVLPQTHRGPQLCGWVDNPGQELALVYFGGASEPIELRRQSLAQAFPHHTRYLVPYRGFGPNAHLLPGENVIKEDALRLARHVRRKHEGLHLIGRSLGTGMAIHVASRIPIMGMALITPYDSILEVAKANYKWLPVAKMLRDRFESWRDAGRVSTPVIALLAEVDKVVPQQRTAALLRHLPQPPSCCTIKGSNHRTIAQFDELWGRISGFFSQDVIELATQAFEAHACNALPGEITAPAAMTGPQTQLGQ